MNLKLENTEYDAEGIFGVLIDEAEMFVAVTLQRAYDAHQGNGSYIPKLPKGVYTCKRSKHRLHGMKSDFETFEVMNVPGHTGILFHWGNFNKDSEGCILLGQQTLFGQHPPMITKSRATFAKFMTLQDGINTFTLTVI